MRRHRSSLLAVIGLLAALTVVGGQPVSASNVTQETPESAAAGSAPAVAGSPIGTVDASGYGPGIWFSGWVIDPDGGGSWAGDVMLYIDGRQVAVGYANGYRPDVGAAYPGFGNNRGFQLSAPATAPGDYLGCVVAVNYGPGTNAVLGCRTVTVPPGGGAFGNVDGTNWTPYDPISQYFSGGDSLTVTGWAIDPDTTEPISVHAFVDGHWAGAATANKERPDVGSAYPRWGAIHGFSVLLDGLAPGVHQVCVYAINVHMGSTNPLLACRSAVVRNPVGNLDGLTAGSGSIRARGWALDPDTAPPIDVHLYLDGRWAGAYTATMPRPDVAEVYRSYGPNHGFDVTLGGVGGGTHQVCVYGINVGPVGPGSTNPLIRCRTVAVSGNPFGNLDAAAATSGGITASGWAIDPDTNAPITVHVYVDGRWGGASSANSPRPDVGTAFPAYGDNHGYQITVAADAGNHQVCVYGINVATGTTNPLIGCRTVTVS
jgi:hypothetical protein